MVERFLMVGSTTLPLKKKCGLLHPLTLILNLKDNEQKPKLPKELDEPNEMSKQRSEQVICKWEKMSIQDKFQLSVSKS